MKLAQVRFFEMVTVPGGKMIGEDSYTDSCEQEFRAADGWEITEVSDGLVTLRAPHMLVPYRLRSSDYGSFPLLAPETATASKITMGSACVGPAHVDAPKGKRR